MATPTSKTFTKYLTFPDYDAETERLKLEAWLYLLWDGQDPTEYLLL